MSRRSSRVLAGIVTCIAFVAYDAGTARAGDAEAEDFRQNCSSCHTIGGGRLVGPDLKGATTRRPKEWLVRFLQDPKAMIDSGDLYALKLYEDARRALMPTLQGMTVKRAEGLLALIEEESKLEKSRFAASGVSERAFTADDLERGRRLFLGLEPLAAGGPACVACHQAGDSAWLGGGRLGPDLSDVFARLEGRKALGAWLLAPPTPTMKPVWTGRALDPDTEILPLLAYFQDLGRRGETSNSTPRRLTFVFLACGVAAVALVLMDRLGRKRFRGVRADLVSRTGPHPVPSGEDA